jgi:hypothetical protein
MKKSYLRTFSGLVDTYIREVEIEAKRPVPLALPLFGDYRKDDYITVPSGHTADLIACLNILCGQQIQYTPEVLTRILNS